MARFPFSAQERRCLDAILRFSYGGLRANGGQGPPRKTCTLSYGRIAQYANLDRRTVQKTLSRLIKMHALNRWSTKTKSFSWGIQKDFERWERCRPRTPRTVGPQAAEVSPLSRHGCRPSTPTATVDSQATPQDVTPNPTKDSPPWESVAPEPASRLSTDSTDTDNTQAQAKKPAFAAAVPRHFHQLPDEMKDRLNTTIKARGWKTAPDFNAHAWIGRTLRTRPGYDPEALEWILERVNPNGKPTPGKKNELWGICNDLLTQAENQVFSDRIKAETALSPRGSMRSIGEILGGSK